jgi:hypothetical protein
MVQHINTHDLHIHLQQAVPGFNKPLLFLRLRKRKIKVTVALRGKCRMERRKQLQELLFYFGMTLTMTRSPRILTSCSASKALLPTGHRRSIAVSIAGTNY